VWVVNCLTLFHFVPWERKLIAQEISEHVLLMLSSGETVKVRGIELFRAEDLGKIAGRRAEAAQKMGGVSTGLGSLDPQSGSSERAWRWVLSKPLCPTITRNQVSACLHKPRLYQSQFAPKEKVFQIESIKHIERPSPDAWVVENAGVKTSVPGVDSYGKPKLINKVVSANFAHSGDDFLGVETENGFMSIRWSSVVGYVGPNRAKPSDVAEVGASGHTP
jgi:hypothetical protein